MKVGVLPITDADLDDVCDFLQRQMHGKPNAMQWRQALSQPWLAERRNHGYKMVEGNLLVGVMAVIYSQRIVEGQQELIANLASWRVSEAHAEISMEMLKSLLQQPNLTVVATNPSHGARRIYQALGFQMVPLLRRVLLPHPGWGDTAKMLEGADALAVLPEAQQLAWREHASFPWLHQAVLQDLSGGKPCHLVWQRGMWKRLPAAMLLHIGAQHTLLEHHHSFSRWLLRQGLFSAHVEQRMLPALRVGTLEDYGIAMAFLSERLSPAQLSYLYTEQAALPWE
ncbi:hypothetical protein Mmc1_3310 [Magnetococcus marinus MC-1]|uniref:N-acetyltransferase domain-containing protein n=1 Tax=Magnetococcus marinus (strain ATCC BAA-1437 / JCM 17883 / MC-1) TaxID=156889 RepID=A0LCV6_MAGMM|nr:hypothetical protein [Magnetococcus marinus]ABK45799.1 hypothetical protein Mmc1_3310 [Magnetococcus marinus MC-1]